jgi:uncharacterized protein
MRRKRLTLDKGPPGQGFYTTEEIGPSRSLTPEGFLLCRDVPIARTGEMLYGPGEVPVSPGSDGVVHIERTAKELLNEDTVSSFNGKPAVNDHPAEHVTPLTWRELSVGIVMHPRAETQDGVGLILADILITDPIAIQAVQEGKREVSCGYDADYEELSPGRGRQTNIIGNHVALVDRGRCGPRCSIGDQQTLGKEHDPMATKGKGGTRRAKLAPFIRKAFRDAEEAAISGMSDPGSDLYEEPEGEEPDGDEGDNHTHVHVHLNGEKGTPAGGGQDEADPAALGDPAAEGDPEGGDPVEARFAAIESAISQLAEAVRAMGGQGGGSAPPAGEAKGDEMPEGLVDPDEQDPPTKKADFTGDSAALSTTFADVMGMAEILVPGFKLPTFDAKLSRKATVDAMCGMRKKVLTHLAATADGTTLLASVHTGPVPDIATMDCAQAAVLFRGAATAKKVLNNRKLAGDSRTHALPGNSNGIPVFGMQGLPAAKGTRTVADLQAQFAAIYGSKQ